MKNETLHLIAGFNNIQTLQTVQTYQIFPSHIHCMEMKGLNAMAGEGWELPTHS
jgi:hypothetical protein